MTSSHESALEALDGFWSVIRDKADADPTFARALVSALNIPIAFKIEPPLDAEAFKAVHAFISPRALVDQGEERFREFFNTLTDAQKRTVIKNHNFASVEAIKTPKGVALVDILWKAAKAQADRMDGR
jgi:hypothetical protein